MSDPFTVEHYRSWALELELDNGEPYIVEDYFSAFLEDYFGGVPECWLIVPEANAKTTNFAGLSLYCLEFRRNPVVNWAASSRDQATLGFTQAEGFVLRSQRLSKLFKCQSGFRKIKRVDGRGRIQIFATDDSTGDGVIPTDSLLDELHRHKNLKLYRTWAGKSSKRSGQVGTISTAGEPNSDFELQREKIRQETPVIDRRPGYIHCRNEFLALHEYAVPEGADVTHMPTVKLANPFSGITVESLALKFASPTMTIPHWSRMTCNIPTRSDFAAIQEQEWLAARVSHPIPAGEKVWVGLDVAFKWDTTALVPLWWRDDEYRLFGPARVLVPPRDGNSLDVGLIQRAIVEIHELNPVEMVVMDTSHAEDLYQWIVDNVTANVVDRQQTNPLAVEDYQRFMKALRNGWLKHAGDPGLTQHALNAVARVLPFGDARFDRPSTVRRSAEQDRRVIDALTAAAMVHSAAAVQSPVGETEFAWA